MIEIRRATLHDLRTVKSIDEALFGKDSYPLFVLRQFFDIAKSLFIVAVSAGEVVGYTIGHHDQERQEGWVLSLGVLPAFAGKEIGKQLTVYLLQALEAKGARTVFLTVHPSNTPALSLYKKLGFGEQVLESSYYLDGSPRLVMQVAIAQAEERLSAS
ncbi:GNAT family N-acetyltransferase [Pontibacter sp. SGAir0037]|uniref:GNAT family N-acetyltransferase n=1 Tax=Pontibacter sp. SGAir0037 TaxID=2571030 RepID=UPI0010CD5468|nr:N-acetyltransferase [Pontibacter sp. SGAir0037]QCR24249.1 GNAT family N-acetyltransferase [Pontibacter sp. SGAir0037]